MYQMEFHHGSYTNEIWYLVRLHSLSLQNHTNDVVLTFDRKKVMHPHPIISILLWRTSAFPRFKPDEQTVHFLQHLASTVPFYCKIGHDFVCNTL